ncbi:MAG: HipA family kinase, partial [Olleya sp.]
GSITFDPLASVADPLTASKVVLLDSIISNIDRTVKNPNVLNWNKELWVIDNGASFYFHHNWETWENHLTRTFPLIKDHVLLDRASKFDEASQQIIEKLSLNTIDTIINTIPEDWLINESDTFTPNQMKAAYKTYLNSRLEKINLLVKEAKDAR